MFSTKFKFSFLMLFVLLSISAFGQQETAQSIASQYEKVQKLAPREKIYVHFDKPTYLSLDTIWFKAYLVDAAYHSYSTTSGLVYFDIISSEGQVMQTLALPTTLGLTWGSFLLKEDSYPPGIYTFRAYTKWMQNFGNTYIFKKEIRILSLTQHPEETKKTKPVVAAVVGEPINSSKIARDIDIQFLPESGIWLTDIFQKMAFKAISTNGKSIPVKGEVINSKGDTITSFKSNTLGMGYFSMNPLSDENYTVKIISQNGQFTKNLPKARPIGSIIQLKDIGTSDSLNITVYSTLVNQELTIIGQSRGSLIFFAPIKPNKVRTVVKIAKSLFSTGTSQIVLLDSKKQAINERNFFMNLKDQLKVAVTMAKTEYGVRDSIPMKIKVTDNMGKPISGSFSLAVTDDFQVSKDASDANILSYLLLSSDLKGEIENPGYYFSGQSEQIKNDLDALMLTQGWVSYEWDVTKKLPFKAEKEYTISGRITNVSNKPSVGAKILLLGKNKSTMILDTLTNNNGEFVFDQLPPMDSASFVIQALNSKGKKGTLGITLEEFQRPVFQPAKKNIIANPTELDSTALQLVTTKNQEYQANLK